jgi:hypothetical protein
MYCSTNGVQANELQSLIVDASMPSTATFDSCTCVIVKPHAVKAKQFGKKEPDHVFMLATSPVGAATLPQMPHIRLSAPLVVLNFFTLRSSLCVRRRHPGAHSRTGLRSVRRAGDDLRPQPGGGIPEGAACAVHVLWLSVCE